MAYPTRKHSEGDVYHVITRGVGQQIIFEDDEDRTCFARFMREDAEDAQVEIWAWCLMSNHVHLLLHGSIDDISHLMQRVKSSYARYFNKRHGRSGTLFQGRFTSVAIETDRQLMTAVRYIHLNPIEAGERLDNPWSSYGRFAEGEGSSNKGTELILELFGGRVGFVRSHEGSIDASPDYLPKRRLSETEALELAKKILAPTNVYDVRSLSKAERNEKLAQLKAAGLSVRQISRLTSIGQGIVARA